MRSRELALFASLVLFACVALASPSGQYNNPDLILVIGQNDLLASPPATFGAPSAIDDMINTQNWNFAQVTSFWNESRQWFASQFGIFFDDTATNTPYFSIDRFGRAAMLPLSAVNGKYRVFGAIDNDRWFPVRSNPNFPPSVKLIEFVVLFDLTQIIPGWQFTPFNYGGNFATQNLLPPAVERSDNLACAIYRIGTDNFNMRVNVPSKVAPLGLGTSRESYQLCHSTIGAGLGVLRVDSFAFAPNAQGKHAFTSLHII